MELSLWILTFAVIVNSLTLIFSAAIRVARDYATAKKPARAKLPKETNTCEACGKPYTPLMDERYQPEPAICRDCLWKLTHDIMFGDD